MTLGFFCLDFLLPPVIIYISFFEPQINPPYYFVQHYPAPVKLLTQIATCFFEHITLHIVMLSLLTILNGILVTYMAIRSLTASVGLKKRINQLDLGFEVGIKIYQKLSILTIIQSELARDLIVPCLHHFHLIVVATICMYYFILQFLPGGEISMVIVALAFVGIGLGGLIEYFAICYIAKAATLSNEFKRKSFIRYGHDKVKRAVIRGLLPLSIDLESLRSMDTIEHGVKMDYYLRYLERVTDHTVSLLLTGV